MTTINYMELISDNYPNINCSSSDPSIYEGIVWDSGDELPSKDVLDGLWFQKVKADKLAEINAFRDNWFTTQGFWFQGHIYDCDALSKTNVTGTITAIVVGQTLPADFTWRSKLNEDIPMNNTQLTGLGLMMGAYVTTIFKWSWQLKSVVDAMTTLDQIDSFVVADMWPNNNYDGTGPGGVSTMASIEALASHLS